MAPCRTDTAIGSMDGLDKAGVAALLASGSGMRAGVLMPSVAAHAPPCVSAGMRGNRGRTPCICTFTRMYVRL